MGGAASYKLWPVFTYCNGFWEVYSASEGFFCLMGGFREGVYAGELSMEELVMVEENFHEGAQDFVAFF